MIEFGTFLAYIAALLGLAFLCVGACVVMSFIVDVLVAAVRAVSLVALNVKASRRNGPVAWPAIFSSWRSMLFAFYRGREKRNVYTLTDNGRDIARWRGVFRWEIIDLGEKTSGVAE